MAQVSCRLGIRVLQNTQIWFLAPCLQATVNQAQVRYYKHYKPEFKKLRKLKVIKVDLPNLNEKYEDMTEEQRRQRMKERGILPPRPWMERPFYLSSTGAIFESYVPPEGDGKMSIISKSGVKQKYEFLEKKSKSMLAIRKIRSYDEDFEPPEFAVKAQDLYIEAHNALIQKNKLKLREVVTERAYAEMMHNIKDKTMHWKFIKSLEPPKVVHARNVELISKDNPFAQITVRFHTQQSLAIYDRFGRLIHGSEILAKDVLEYVVFEKHIANEYGIWRLHGKLIPDWMPGKEPSAITYVVVEEEEEKEAVVETPDVATTENKEPAEVVQ